MSRHVHCLDQFNAAGVMHLTQVNPQIPGASGSLPKQLLSQWHLPRVSSAMPQASWRQLPICGTSAFAFQGTNAHIIQQETPVPQAALQPAVHDRAVVWQQQSHWVAPPVSAFISGLISTAAGGMAGRHRTAGVVILEVDLAGSRAAFLKQHRVLQTSVMPAAGCIQLCSSAIAVMLHHQDTSGMLHLAFGTPAPATLPALKHQQQLSGACIVR